MSIDIENLREARETKGYTQKEVAELLGVAPSTYNLYENGKRKPDINRLFKLIDILQLSLDEVMGHENGPRWDECMHETVAEYYTEGGSTCEDFYSYKGDRRFELIYGTFVEMCMPSRRHQDLVMEISYALRGYIGSRKGGCKVYPGALAVNLDEAKRLILVPDIAVICDPEKLDDRGCNGAPDLVIEILSPSTAKRDMVTKLNAYQSSGVREYWIVDGEKERVITYCFEQEDLMHIYGFTDDIPVGIFPGLSMRLEEML